MPMDGSTYGRARRPMHTGLLTAKGKEKQKKNPKRTLPIHDVPFALHFRRGSRQPPSPLSKPRARPRRQSRHPRQGLAVSGLCWSRPAAGDSRAAGACTRGPCRPRAQGLGTRTRALTCATSHASDATTAEGWPPLSAGKSPFKLGRKKPYTICITVEGKRDYLE